MLMAHPRKFESDWELEGFVLAGVEEIAQKYSATVDYDERTGVLNIVCERADRYEMAREIEANLGWALE